MKRIDFLQDYRRMRKEEQAPRRMATLLIGSSLGLLLLYGFLSTLYLVRMKSSILEADEARARNEELEQSIKGTKAQLVLLQDQVKARTTALRSEEESLQRQLALVDALSPRITKLIELLSQHLPRQASVIHLELVPGYLQAEGFGLTPPEVLTLVAQLGAQGCPSELVSLLARRRGDQEELFFRLRLSTTMKGIER